ncbi:hypothetical protein [Deinococcus sp. Leaf326]|uniref:hypothetical protein n=1 Tax=Deinococcus sp. Leaf326 TaxID=1736338 RepID=UPI0006F24C70|nr:hypothetical protein [Deinococcus sp. Leaf326]KQQ99395.1 hypothetical protein ASF71_13525 [Deinococcus sp. Leaf326]
MTEHSEYRTEQEEARERLKQSIDALAERANLQVQMQKEPLKMLGGASAVGALVGMVVGRQFRRSKKIYVDAGSPVKHQKGLVKAQQKQQGQSVGGALAATLATLAVKTLTDRVLSPKLEEIASGLLEKAGQAPQAGARPTATTGRQAMPVRPASAARSDTPATRPESPTGTAAFLKRPADGGASLPTAAESASAQASADGSAPPRAQAHPGIVPMPASHVEAKAQGTPLSPEEKANPNAH